MPPARLSPVRRILFTSILAALVVIYLEIFLQIFYFASVGDFLFRRALPPIYAADPVRCYRVASDLDYVHRTNEFEIQIYTNSLGLRTDASHREYAKPKPDDVYRILVTGPSFAFGWGANYEEIFPTLIERGLSVPGKRVEVMNLGTPSQGSAHQLCWMKEVGYAYQPDMVLHVSYGNEVNPVAMDCPTRAELECPTIEDGQLVPAGVDSVARAKAFVKRFALVFYGYYAWNAVAKPEPVPDATRSLYAKGETASGSETSFEALADTYAGHVDFLKHLLGERTQVAFIYLPYSFAVHPDDIVRFPGLTPEDVPITRERIAAGVEAVTARGLPILDTLPPLMKAASDHRLYYWLDIHFTPYGNRVVAEVATPFVQELIDRSQP
ncbi:MAG: hypothetical protein IPK00_24460 [Deltaproteobacteria bacterium]|nr:hypothetical protein [Deltaproteobacteria bacterium]